jgi:hypothetical protein
MIRREYLKTLTIHGIDPKFFGKIQWRDYNLTFDDGLFSQYYYWPLLKGIPITKIFFITTNLIGIDGLGKRKKWKGKMQEFPDCFEALDDYRETGNRENYMRLEELQDIMQEHNVVIGGHGHNHIKYYHNRIQIEQDIISMMDWFEKHLAMRPKYYAYPHYVNPVGMDTILKKHGIEKTFGGWRLEIEEEINLLSNV